MKKYARIDDEVVAEIIAPMIDDDGKEIEIERRFHPDIIATLRDITDQPNVAVGWIEESGVLTAPPAPKVETVNDIRLLALTDIRAQRAPLLDALAGIGFDAVAAGDDATIQAVASCRQGLKDITSTPGFIAAQTYDDMKAAIMLRYKQIAAAAPASVQVAFAALLS